MRKTEKQKTLFTGIIALLTVFAAAAGIHIAGAGGPQTAYAAELAHDQGTYDVDFSTSDTYVCSEEDNTNALYQFFTYRYQIDTDGDANFDLDRDGTYDIHLSIGPFTFVRLPECSIGGEYSKTWPVERCESFEQNVPDTDYYSTVHFTFPEKISWAEDDFTISASKTKFTYTGKAQIPSVTVVYKGNKLTEDTDYELIKIDNSVSADTYYIWVNMKGKFVSGIAGDVKYTISKAANPLKVSPKTATVTYSKLKKKNQTLLVTKVIKTEKKGKGTVTYSKVSGNSKITIAAKTGKVTVKKGLKKGNYKVKVKVKAAGTANYKAVTRTITFTIKVK